MPANTDPIFPKNSYVVAVAIATANTGRDGTGTLGTLVSGTTEGTQIEWIEIQAAGNTTLGVVRFFYDDGTNKFLLNEILIPQVTAGTSVAAYRTVWRNSDGSALMTVKTAHFLKCATHNAETFNVNARVGDY